MGSKAGFGVEIGFLGLGAMGAPMVRNLLEAGYEVVAYDPNPERLSACASFGAVPARNEAEVVSRTDVVLTSLPSSEAFVEVAEGHLLPNCRPGQVFIDLGTTAPPETRRLAAAFEAKGAVLLDAPVSGGPQGVETRSLRIFAAGDKEVFERCRPILEALGGPDWITYCGPSGSGQVVKGVNQLAMGLSAAAYLEAVAFGVMAGVDPGVIRRAVGGSGGAGNWREYLDIVAKAVEEGNGKHIGVKFRELPYFLREAEEKGFELPLTRVLYSFCDAGERVVVDDNRPAPSLWYELTKTRELKSE